MDPKVIVDVVVFLVFLVAAVAIGIVKRRGEDSSEGYFLAGRGLTWWLIGFSLIAANISAEQFVGMSGQAAKESIGLAVASYEWIAAVTLVLVAFFFLPKFLRSGIYTIPEYLEYRFTHGARTLMSLLMVAILVGVTTSTVIYLGAKALIPVFPETVAGLSVNITTLSWLVGVVAAIYVTSGGLKACAWTDLIFGSGLLLGGAVVMCLTFMALAEPEKFAEVDPQAVYDSLGVTPEASFAERFQVLKDRNMHMVLPRASDFLPWTALLFGIWIPNLYYWGLNQYIMQRTLGAHSLADGQKGIVFAAWLKLVIPFLVCIPGIVAFTLYGPQMQQLARDGKQLNSSVLERFAAAEKDAEQAKIVFPFDGDFAKLYPDLAQRILSFNLQVAGADAATVDAGDGAAERSADYLAAASDDLKAEIQGIQDDPERELGLADLNGMAIEHATRVNATWLQSWYTDTSADVAKQQELIGYDHDSAFPLLIGHLTPTGGVRGFVLAALMGAVISSLASMLNAASTIFTMDLYREYFNPSASQGNLVAMGRLCVVVFVVIACLIAPQLGKPEFKGAFAFIQEFQGYVSPGVLTIFLFGLFIPRAPRMCGVVGLLLSPIIYGYLHAFWSDMAFLNRMAVTLTTIAVVLGLLSLLKPLAEPVTLPVQTKIALDSSAGAKFWGVAVVIATVALYWVFF